MDQCFHLYHFLISLSVVFCGQSETNYVKDSVASESEAAASSSGLEPKYSTYSSPIKVHANKKSIGSFENFWDAYIVACRTIFDSSMQVMWNAVFYDPLVEYSSAWRKRKLWSGRSAVVKQGISFKEYEGRIEKPLAEAVSCCILMIVMVLFFFF